MTSTWQRACRDAADVSFHVAAAAYDRFMGVYSQPLAVGFADLLDGPRVLDVGCGPGALTAELVRRELTVAAVDPSPPFVEAARTRFPGVDVRRATAEDLPYDDGSFDAAAAQLVVPFMGSPLAGIREMSRVAGTVAACVWDHAGGSGPLAAFWQAARRLDPAAPDEADQVGAADGQLGELFEAAGLRDVRTGSLQVRASFAAFEDWWELFTLGVGPAGAYAATVPQEPLREACRAMLPEAPFTISARAWTAVGRV